ncbi:hypothetical protein BJ912DRAFT_1047855 [Pholiota molesta]|nr:hypothetical protein BJ912DRAFT_1047855 [Pholiota molesta]
MTHSKYRAVRESERPEVFDCVGGKNYMKTGGVDVRRRQPITFLFLPPSSVPCTCTLYLTVILNGEDTHLQNGRESLSSGAIGSIRALVNSSSDVGETRVKQSSGSRERFGDDAHTFKDESRRAV